jgi:hypothetical protein
LAVGAVVAVAVVVVVAVVAEVVVAVVVAVVVEYWVAPSDLRQDGLRGVLDHAEPKLQTRKEREMPIAHE